MKFNIVSDLHQEKNGIIELNKHNHHVIVCGDVVSNYNDAIVWEKDNSDITFVYGNHDYYDGNITYDNLMKHKTIEDVVVIYGTLWTDFNLNNNQKECMELANRINTDYNNTTLFFGDVFTAEHARELFEKNVNIICELCEKYCDMKIVIATHFAPSAKSIPASYKRIYSPMFASNLEWIMEKYDNIKLWAHGHVHTSYDYTVGQCRVVCNPIGFINDDFPDCYNKIDLNFVVEI